MTVTNLPVIDRIPPQNLEAEMALIGSVLVDRDIMGIVCEIIRPEDFYAHVHESIFGALMHLYDRGEPLDKITVAEELKRRGQLDNVGGLPYLSSLMDTVQSAASAAYYAKIVREKAVLRGLIHAGTRITQLGFEHEEDVEGALDQSEQMVYEIGMRQNTGEFTPVSRLLKPAFEHIDKLFHSRGDRTGLTAGFRDIDEMTTGFQPGNFIIVAARPGMGKTSFALNMAVAAAREESDPVAFFSLEMSNDELVQRLICAEAHISMHDMRRGNIKTHHWEKISDAMGVLNELPIYLDDAGGLSVSEIRSRCRRLKSAHGLSAVFIDYLQLVRPGVLSKGANRNEELSDICRTLKMTAKDLAVPIIALAQLNRGVETRQDKRPMLSDLRDCLAGDSLVTNADTGERVAIRDIVERGLRFNVWAADPHLKLVRRPILDAWSVGEKPTYQVTTRSGRTIRCTGGHRFFAPSGWFTLNDLEPGKMIAVPCAYPTAASVPHMTEAQALLLGWLMGDGYFGGSPLLTVASAGEAQLASALGASEFGLRPAVKAMSRTTCAMLAERLNDEELAIWANTDVLWDEITSIEPCGIEQTFDITVGDLHNFCVDDFLTHNSGSLEQESDMVAFLYREGYYNNAADDPDVTEFIIAKHRNGPTGMVRLRFQREYTLFVPFGDESHYPAAI